ncbi:MAG: hypothetical protein DBX55_04580 [Verrucomicrobia bacterium]|nr:MAG: hypothetical protein DBX55_04580 [Verrucomicrobiota bacterium]
MWFPYVEVSFGETFFFGRRERRNALKAYRSCRKVFFRIFYRIRFGADICTFALPVCSARFFIL